MDLLKLGALDEQDLQAISANMQDAVMRVGDIKYLAAKKQFAMLVNRFNWETAESSADGYQRRRSGLHFNSVNAVRSNRISNKADDAVLELLAISFTGAEAPSGVVQLDFAGGGAIQLEVECIDAWLSDLGPEWDTNNLPQHELDAEAD